MTQKEYKEASRRIIVSLLIAIVMIVGSTALMVRDAYQRGRLYTLTGTVTEVDQEARLTTFVDTEGECWRFRGVKNWEVNDAIIVTVNSNDTEDFHDDEVVGARRG